jgi:hypothetical protein
MSSQLQSFSVSSITIKTPQLKAKFKMVNALSTPSTWSRQDVLALLQLLTMVLVSVTGAFWHVLTRQHHSK